MKIQTQKLWVVLLVVLSLGQVYASTSTEFKKIGYLMNWRATPNQDRISGFSHIILTGLKLHADSLNGALDTSIVPATKVKDLVDTASLSDTKVMIMVGGWGNHVGFSEMAADSAYRLRFAQELASFCVTNGLSGADIDWEFPEGDEFLSFLEMLKLLRIEFDKHSLLLTIAAGDSHSDDFPFATWGYLDWVNVMAYDMNWTAKDTPVKGNHSPADLYLTLLPVWESAGVPKSKLVLGMPFYGRNNSNWGDAVAYSTIHDAVSLSKSENMGNGYHFNGYNTIYNKSGYSLENGYAGVMVWEIGQDVDPSEDLSLQRAMNEGVEDAKSNNFELKPISLDVNKKEFLKVGYFRHGTASPSVERVTGFTHIIMNGLKLDELKLDGSLDTTHFVGNSKILNLVDSSNQAGAEVMLMVGGWANSGGFSEMAADSAKIQKFATELAGFCVRNGVKGADIDWEFPSASEFNNFLEMMKVLRVEFDKDSLLLTIATGDQHYDDFPSATWAYTDWVNIMAYDMNWVPANTKVTANHSPADVYLTLVPLWEGAGVPREKIVLGLPFYGRGNNNRADAVTYASIYNANTPSASENIGGDYHFNGYNTIYNKTGYMLSENYGGVMVWAIDQDLPASHSASLQGAIVEADKDAKNDNFSLLPITLDVENMDDIIVVVEQDFELSYSNYKVYNSKGVYLQNLNSGEEFRSVNLPKGVYYLVNKNERLKVAK